MIQIDRHIEVLLLSNDCVIVPDLGGFMAYHVPARYVKETGQFVPPSRQLGFNAQLKINDSLLAQSYIEAYDISYPEALRRIEAEVEEMRQMIQNTGMCELNDIGMLRLNEHGNIEFEPCEAGILTPDLYGLNTLDIMPLSYKVEVEKKPVIDISSADTEKTYAEGEKKDDIVVTPILPAPIDIVAKADDEDVLDNEANSDNSSVIDVVKRVIAIAAVVLSLFIIAVPVGSPSHQMARSYLDSGFLYNLFTEKQQAPVVTPVAVKATENNTTVSAKKEARKAESVKAETKRNNIVAETNKDKKVGSQKVEDKKETSAKVVTSDSYYAIVLASCVPHKNAADVVKKLSKDGLADASVVDRSNGSKVVYGHYSSENEARSSLRSLRSQSNSFEKGWVMKFN